MSYHLQNMVDDNAAGYQRSKGEKKPVQRGPRWYRSVYETAVMRALAAFADGAGGSCFPSVATLADECPCSERKVKSVLKEFQKRGLIRIKRTRGSNRYQILPHGFVVPKPADSEQSAKKTVYAGEVQNSQELKAPCTPSKVRHAHLESAGRAPSKCTPCTSESACHAHESYHINSSNSHRHLFSLSNSADALLEREKPYPHQGVGKEEDNQEEPFFVTNPRKSAGIITPLETAGDALRFPPPARPGPEAQKYPCPCGFTHPPGMPSLEEIRVELRELHPEPEYLDIWVADDAEHLHDIWLANGFQMKNGPIKNWKASLRNWQRWQKEH